MGKIYNNWVVTYRMIIIVVYMIFTMDLVRKSEDIMNTLTKNVEGREELILTKEKEKKWQSLEERKDLSH